jgi:hypothetical protein
VLDVRICTSSPSVHLHPVSTYAGARAADCTWGVPRSC